MVKKGKNINLKSSHSHMPPVSPKMSHRLLKSSECHMKSRSKEQKSYQQPIKKIHAKDYFLFFPCVLKELINRLMLY